jgi:hypothetical protein
LFGGWRLESKWPVQLKAVSRVIYPVPTKSTIPDAMNSPIEIGVPSSSSWKPTTALRSKNQHVAAIAPRWAAVNPLEMLTGETSSCERLAHLSDFISKREATDGEDLAYLNNDVTD